ncbi:hypothetical protein [Streptomyces lutosisoli]|uniref:Uncharacterized protein n=1 Tax=Streptomyces lutosisoli TaxID=2665721 RepID=A0ABW2VZW7_9ACTN
MIELTEPMATAAVRWLSEAEGGRRSGPPTAPVYAATAAFPSPAVTSQDSVELELLSVLVQRIAALPDGRDLANIGFLVPELARPRLHTAAEFVITEGLRTVARAEVRELFPPTEPDV